MQHLSKVSTHHDQYINVNDASSICIDIPVLDKPSAAVSWVFSGFMQEVDLDYVAIFQGSDYAILKAARFPDRASIAGAAMMHMDLDGYSEIFTGAVVEGTELAGVQLKPLLISDLNIQQGGLGAAASPADLMREKYSRAEDGSKQVVVFC